MKKRCFAAVFVLFMVAALAIQEAARTPALSWEFSTVAYA
jgi:hypothetical protein